MVARPVPDLFKTLEQFNISNGSQTATPVER